MSLETMALLNDDPIVKLPAMAAGVLSVSRISLPWPSIEVVFPIRLGLSCRVFQLAPRVSPPRGRFVRSFDGLARPSIGRGQSAIPQRLNDVTQSVPTHSSAPASPRQPEATVPCHLQARYPSGRPHPSSALLRSCAEHHRTGAHCRSLGKAISNVRSPYRS